jgi:hypothetical protein
MISLKPIVFIFFGAVLAILGFLYDLSFAGIPYQDPSPEVEATWSFHSGIANRIIFVGVLLFFVGCVWGALRHMAIVSRRRS